MGSARRSRTAAAAAVGLGAVFGFHRIVDVDVLHHVAVGRAILADPASLGRSWFVEAFPAYPYVEDKWLSQVLVALLDRALGVDGLMLYQLLLTTAVAIAWFAMLRAWRAGPWAALAGTAVALLACAYRLEPRPDTASHALLAATMALVGPRASWARSRWLVPLLLALWVNLHGYFVNGILVCLAAAAAALLGDRTPGFRRGPDGRRRALVLLVMSVAACVAHPQGVRALVWPLVQLVTLRGEPALVLVIQEFSPTWPRLTGMGSARDALLAATLAAAILLGVTRAGRRTFVRQAAATIAVLPWLLAPPPGLEPWSFRVPFALAVMAFFEVPAAVRRRRLLAPLLLLGMTVLALPVRRNVTLVPPVALLMIVPAWTLLGRAAREAVARVVPVVGVAATLALVVILAWARLADYFAPGSPRAYGRAGWGLEAGRYPVGAVDAIARAGLPGPFFNTFDASGQFLLRLYPRARVFVSSNTSLQPASFLGEYWDVVRLRGDVDELARRWGLRTLLVDFASLGTDALLAWLARDPRWRIVYLDDAGAVFMRADDPASPPAVDIVARAADLRRRPITLPLLPAWLHPRPALFPELNLALFLDALGHPDLALAEAERLGRAVTHEDLEVFAAETAERAGRLPERVPALEDARRRFPGSAAVAGWLGRALTARADAAFRRGAVADARRDLERLAELWPDAPAPAYGLARLAAREGDRDRAREWLARALRGDNAAMRQLAERDPDLAPLLP